MRYLIELECDRMMTLASRNTKEILLLLTKIYDQYQQKKKELVPTFIQVSFFFKYTYIYTLKESINEKKINKFYLLELRTSCVGGYGSPMLP